MEKEKIIEKLNIKNYNKELENILQEKNFSEVCNNLLLSMLYKIENAYEDYKKVKVETPNKKEYIEELLDIIEKDCQTIEIVKINAEDAIDLNATRSSVKKSERKITTYQNELALLEAIYELNYNDFNINSIDLIRKRAISSMLNIGEIAFKCEPLRDFDGWSWNTNIKEIKEYNARTYYQILVYLLGYEQLNNNKNMNILELERILKEKYKPQMAERLFKLINQVAIKEYLKNNKNDIEYLTNIKEEIYQKYKLMDDKKIYIDEVTKEKKDCIKEIEEIDRYINNDLTLKKEYIRQNEILSQEDRVFSLSDFSEKVENRKKYLNERIIELTEKLKPKNFVKEKTRLENNYKYINELNLEDLENNELWQDLIKEFLKSFEMQITESLTKKEIIEKFFELRYLKLFNLDSQIVLGDVYKKQVDKIEKKLTTIACKQKIITIFSKDIEENYKVYKNIFETKIIDLESICIEIGKNEIKVFDENSLEKEEKCSEYKDLIVKHNKKIKIFI